MPAHKQRPTRHLLAVIGLISILALSLTLTRAAPPVPPEEALAGSLTDEQRQAIAAIVARYDRDLAGVTVDLFLPDAGPNKVYMPQLLRGTSEQAPASTPRVAARDQSADQQALARISALKAQMDQELSGVLTAEQYASYLMLSSLPGPVTASAPASASLAANSDTCFYASYRASQAHYYALISRSTAFVVEYLYPSSSTAANISSTMRKAETYQRSALANFGGAFMNLYAIGYDSSQFTIYGLDDQLSARDSAQTGRDTSYSFYLSTGSSWAYLTYYFAYYQAFTAGEAYSYGSSCD